MINEIITKKFDDPQDYIEFSHIQDDIHADVLKTGSPGYLLFLEYKDIFTIGRFAKNIDAKVDFIKSSRGGDITFHGIGQLIIYPILNIKSLGISLREYIDLMHNFLINFLNSKNISATRNKKGPGLWVDNHKISFLGIAVKKGITLHGISININCNLENFKLINPCGDSNINVGNLRNLQNIKKEVLIEELENFFKKELSLYIS